jgi:hypothetical protein
MRRDDNALFLEFEFARKSLMRKFKDFFEEPDKPQEVRIPLDDITSLSYGWGWGKPPFSIDLKVRRLAALAGTPGSQLGQVRLYIPRDDRDLARQLVEGIAHAGFLSHGPRLPPTDRARARQAVAVPALGLAAAGVLGVASWILLAVMIWDGRAHPQMLALLLAAPLALMQMLGGFWLLRLRYFPLVAAASIVAMIPWSPAFLISLPFGIWTCILLGKPEIAGAFQESRRLAAEEPDPVPDPRFRVGGRVLSFMRSVAGYILPTMAGRKEPGENSTASR